jgi:nitrite reductase/ring-hydroxylating ferredoxin subunit/DMSO/TMAO reductase YedYZ heme-binding membrane subunit
MSHQYVAVGWNRQKKVYDLVSVTGTLTFLAAFIGIGLIIHPNATIETLLIRAFGAGALLLLHIILCIGPLTRLSTVFLPLLYNRRHLGVTMFFLALIHGTFSIIQFHALGDVNPLVSLLISNTRLTSPADFPFQLFGLVALLILLLMAATSHDFWLKNLTAPVWKSLHMLVYAAYALLLAHVLLGSLQAETSMVQSGLLAVGMLIVLSLHLLAAMRERKTDAPTISNPADGFVEVCRVADIPDKRARVISLSGERMAVFKYDQQISAISSVCQHQNGPLGEGRVIDGCVTCPWHGYQYLPASGASPAPFTEKVPTFRVQIINGVIFVNPVPLPAGTFVEPARIEKSIERSGDEL